MLETVGAMLFLILVGGTLIGCPTVIREWGIRHYSANRPPFHRVSLAALRSRYYVPFLRLAGVLILAVAALLMYAVARGGWR